MKLPDKSEGRRDEYGVIMTGVEAKINDIIDYLAEREERVTDLEKMAYPTAYEIQTHADIKEMGKTPLFKAEDIQLLNVGSKYGLVVSSLTKAQAEQAREALLKLSHTPDRPLNNERE